MIGDGEQDSFVAIHLPTVDRLRVTSIHVGSFVLILQVVKEKVLLRMFSHNSEKGRLRFHPVKLFYEGIVF